MQDQNVSIDIYRKNRDRVRRAFTETVMAEYIEEWRLVTESTYMIRRTFTKRES